MTMVPTTVDVEPPDMLLYPVTRVTEAKEVTLVRMKVEEGESEAVLKSELATSVEVSMIEVDDVVGVAEEVDVDEEAEGEEIPAEEEVPLEPPVQT